jgi:hypothetical protein
LFVVDGVVDCEVAVDDSVEPMITGSDKDKVDEALDVLSLFEGFSPDVVH